MTLPRPPSVDKIILRGLHFFGRHGTSAAERELGQLFIVDLHLLTGDLSPAAAADDLHQTVDYAAVYDHVKHVVQGPPRHLLETVATDIIQTLLRQHQRVQEVTCRVSKLHAPLAGRVGLGTVAVEITRSRA
ncbi:hypothetical protein CDCA_CDCA06G2009 [Cyanidium caldarium]|uniref:dihydroneopterin aldolase n=1 Tax=Cyanidium caldarium TaxID=2771 RepID=A0AAV9IV11_CYACA|nr:hypothetical protein CDCA_CDCA06G2009 [Cyanidium caldarium]